MAWASLRFGTLGAALSVVLTSAIAVYGTGEGRGPFHHSQSVPSALIVWVYMATTATLAWMISAIQSSRERASAARQVLERALNDSALGVVLTDAARRITYANEGFLRLTGYSEAESLGREWNFLNGPKTAPDTDAQFNLHIDAGTSFESEIVSHRKDRNPFWNNLTVSPVHDEFARVDGFMFIHRDITARKLAEQALLESESHFRRLIEFAPEAVVLLDLSSGKFTEANESARRLFRLSAEQIRELSPSKMSPRDQPDGGDSESLASYWIGKAISGETPVFEWAHLDSEGNEVLCEVRLLRLDIQGRTYIRGSLTPIAERKRAERALEPVRNIFKGKEC